MGNSETRKDLFLELSKIERQLTGSYFHCFIQYYLMLDSKIILDAVFNHPHIYTTAQCYACYISWPLCRPAGFIGIAFSTYPSYKLRSPFLWVERLSFSGNAPMTIFLLSQISASPSLS